VSDGRHGCYTWVAEPAIAGRPNLSLGGIAVRGRDLLSIADLSQEELSHVLETARALKQGLRPVPQRQAGSGEASNETMQSGESDSRRLLAGKTLALLFEKPSLRTRVSFDVGMRQLGGDCIYVSPAEVGLGTREPVEDVARVMSRYVDCIAARTFAQETVEQLARWADVPVINALSEGEHPCQALADLLTILEHKGRLEGVSLAYIGDGNNVARSLALGAGMMGMEFRIASPEGYELDEKTVSRAGELARRSGGGILCVREAKEAPHLPRL